MILSILFFVIYIASPLVLYAPPEFVWRIDSRPPNEIFRDGMVSWGENMNVYSHLSGESCTELNPLERTSGFISTSASQAWSMFYSLSMARHFTGKTVYLYQIRADNTFYNAVSSLRHYQNESPDALITELNYIPARNANEYISPLNISPSNIESVLIFVSSDGAETTLTYEANDNYISRSTHASREPYNGISDSRGRPTWLRYIPFLGACMASRMELKVKNPTSNKNYPLELVFLPVIM